MKTKLKSVMVLHGDTSQDLADYMGISDTTFSNKLNEKKTVFNLNEIRLIQEKYQLSADQLNSIFFEDKLS